MEQSNPKILIIDDEEGLRDMLTYGLGSRGYSVTVAQNGKEAAARVEREEFDLVLCDLMMPEMEGLETLGVIKEAHPHIEVVMMTGYATLETAAQSMKLGAYDYISKPYEMDALCDILEKALRQRGLKATLGKLETAKGSLLNPRSPRTLPRQECAAG